jgi:phospholipase/carboxylesterase
MPSTNKIHPKNIITAGVKLREAKKALIMVHGRGGSAEDILSLADNLDVNGFALLAPQANNNSWYPYSFMAPASRNEPWLSSALNLLQETVNEALLQGITEENIYFAGFSQGTCLTLEFVARDAKTYGGIAAFTGGLIGERIHAEKYKGNFNSTPIFIGTSDPDPHVPVERVYATTKILKSMNASVTEKVYENMGHTIIMDEIELANKLVFTSI